MEPLDEASAEGSIGDADERAAVAFLRRRAGADLDSNAAGEPDAQSLERIERAWQAVGDHATAPELMALRELALVRIRQAHARRWRLPGGARRRLIVAGAAAALALTVGLGWTAWSRMHGSRDYRTDVGEQRVVELPDGSRIALDCQTRLSVRMTTDARVIELDQGQAEFSVAKDPQRPFRVETGGQTIVAVGTSFTVEYVEQIVRVALLDGYLDVTSPVLPATQASEQPTVGAGRTVHMVAGEALEVDPNGQTTINPKADLDAAVAWRQGKVMFRDEPLGAAVRRLNRYTRLQLELDDAALLQLHVSGVFEAGDTQAFADAIQLYLPVRADYSQPGVVRLSPRR
jgi:transmembrane sensor